jgi:raffinose/stachyose/melibiose transport system permease protein
MAIQANTFKPAISTKRLGGLAVHAILIGLGFLYMYPFLWVLAGSLKKPAEFFSSGLSLIPKQLNLDNYVYAWNAGNFSTYFTNTIIVTV